MTAADVRRSIAALEWMFDSYNKRYFGGRLPKYHVVLAQRVTLVTDPTAEGAAGTDFERGEIIMTPRALENERLYGFLIHEMIHVAVGPDDNHGEAFAAEARRVKALGAPVHARDCVQPYEASGVMLHVDAVHEVR